MIKCWQNIYFIHKQTKCGTHFKLVSYLSEKEKDTIITVCEHGKYAQEDENTGILYGH